MSVMVIYHGNCADGFTAAWAAKEYFRKMEVLDDVQFVHGVHATPPPPVDDKITVIYLLDFCYKRPVMEVLAASVQCPIIVLDHHKSAMEEMAGIENAYPNVQCRFDMERSGAMIAWQYFFSMTLPPPLIAHVQDRDLWLFNLLGTREINAAVFSYEYTFDNWDLLMGISTTELISQGRSIERKHFKDIRELLGVVKRRMMIGGYDVPVANLPYTMSSDAGHIMGADEPFAACYWDTPAGRVFSLRSSDAGVDVSEIARKYGGGGHKHAAGFTIPYLSLHMFPDVTPEV